MQTCFYFNTSDFKKTLLASCVKSFYASFGEIAVTSAHFCFDTTD